MRRLRPSFAPGAAALLAAALVCTPVAAQNAVPPDVAAALEAGGYAAVPMRRHGDAHLTVRMQLNGVPGVFILDTGAGRTVLDRAAQSRFDGGRTPVSGGVATGAGGAGVAIAALPDSRLRIGDYRDEAFTVHVMPLDHVNAAFVRRGEAAVDGVLGADVLERGGAVIDYPNLRLYLRNPGARGGGASSSPSISEQR